jgi:hypothetical protein
MRNRVYFRTNSLFLGEVVSQRFLMWSASL